MNILITGASGFIGSHLTKHFSENENIKLFLLTSNKNLKSSSKNSSIIIYKDFLKINFSKLLKDIDVIIHLISKQHELNFFKKNYSDYYKINVKFTEKLVKEAKKNKITKIIYLSTIKVYGEYSYHNQLFTEHSKTNPQSYYGKTKLLSEKVIEAELENSKTKYSIIRIPLVYGKNSKGNLDLLSKYINTRLPIFFNYKHNKRSLINVINLSEFISLVLKNNNSDNKLLLISDNNYYSTDDIICGIIKKNKKNNLTIYFGLFTLIKILNYLFRIRLFNNLYSNFTCSNQFAKNLMNWNPRYVFNDYINSKS